MSESEYLKCACKECGNNVEFPPSSARTTITCPHCGQWTELLVEGEEEEKEEAEGGVRIKMVPLLIIVVFMAALVGGGVWFSKQQKQALANYNKTATNQTLQTIPAPAQPVVVAPTNSVAQTVTQAVVQAAPKRAPKPKSPDDLKVGKIELEKTKGSSLVYATGTVKNDSDFDRYGVRIELDLFNAKGKKIGMAKDYKDYLGPNQEWQFRALIPEAKTVEARVASLKED